VRRSSAAHRQPRALTRNPPPRRRRALPPSGVGKGSQHAQEDSEAARGALKTAFVFALPIPAVAKGIRSNTRSIAPTVILNDVDAPDFRGIRAVDIDTACVAPARRLIGDPVIPCAHAVDVESIVGADAKALALSFPTLACAVVLRTDDLRGRHWLIRTFDFVAVAPLLQHDATSVLHEIPLAVTMVGKYSVRTADLKDHVHGPRRGTGASHCLIGYDACGAVSATRRAVFSGSLTPTPQRQEHDGKEGGNEGCAHPSPGKGWLRFGHHATRFSAPPKRLQRGLERPARRLLRGVVASGVGSSTRPAMVVI